jgi:predicted phage terminase large subunit-like protein
MRTFLLYFLPWVFEQLHPGEPPLELRWYLRAMCQAFQRAGKGAVKRLVINVPPRHLKSITSIAFVAWQLGRNPNCKIMFVTYGSKLANEHLEKVQMIMSQPFYRSLFPRTVLASNALADQVLKTTHGGSCRAVTVGGAVTGFGADIILIDDAMKADDIDSEARREELSRFYTKTLLPRLNNKRRGVIISIQQRLGDDDLPGWLLEAGAEHLCLPAYGDEETTYDIGMGRIYRRPPGEVLRPDDEPRYVLDAFRREMGPAAFSAEYLQQPSALEGNVIKIDQIPRFDLEDFPRECFEKIIISVDPATSESPRSDWSVLMTFGILKNRSYVLDVMRDHIGYARLLDRIVAQKRLWRADKVLIENEGAGRHLWDDLTNKKLLRPIMIRPEFSKETRMQGQLGMIEAGDLLFPRTAHFLDDLLKECRAFPKSKHDDQVDALSQYLFWAKSHIDWANTPRDPETGRKLFVTRRDKVRRRH